MYIQYSLIGLTIITSIMFLVLIILLASKRRDSLHQEQLINSLSESIGQIIVNNQAIFQKEIHNLESTISKQFLQTQSQMVEKVIKGQVDTNQMVTTNIQQHMKDVREQLNTSFKQHSDSLSNHVHSLTHQVRNNLNDLTTNVNKRLNDGFEKTSSTFTDVVKRLTIIDEAQKKITELSSSVVSLQEVLIDKRARGAFGEVQLSSLIQNVIPQQHYNFQHTLSNNKRVDCMLFLPQPTGNIAIDAKFPLESYQSLTKPDLAQTDKKLHQQQFRQDIQKHIKDIAQKYIIPNETAEGALMFIPAEAIFAEIHANYPELVTLSHKLKVWLVSPSTLMAVLTTARAVIKDDATKKQVHIIQEHLTALSKDFNRFEKRMDNLSRHIEQASKDVNDVNTSAKKITSRFQKIESVEIDNAQLLEANEE
jgi:DNA recombination protein RmuC